MGNELKLSLENFQSISEGELIFHTGTNVIVGQSNSGKTATFRALKACLSNPIGSQRFIKKGTNKASVALEYNGNQIIWKRTPKDSSYTINGEDYLKTGKSNAFKIIEDTGFVLDDNENIMNIEEELQLPFPFGISKSELFKLYENVFCVSDSAVILKAAKEKEEDTKGQISIIESEIVKNKNKLAEVANFKNEVDIKFLEEKRDHLKKSSERIDFLQDGLSTIHNAARICGFEVPEISFENKLSDFEELNLLRSNLIKLKKLHTLGKELKEVQIPQEVDLTSYKELKELREDIEKLKELKNLKVAEVAFTSKLKDYEELQEYSETLKSLKKQIKEKKTDLENIHTLIEQKEEKLKEFKVCPLCHKPLD